MTQTYGPTALATPANALSVVRLLAAPALVVLIIFQHRSWLAAIGWLVISSTDWVDGYVARRQGVTRSGAFLDPLADKVAVLGALGALVALGTLPLLPVVIIGVREVAMSIYRSVAGSRGRSIPARPLAKVKTWVQDVVILLALLPGALGAAVSPSLGALIWLSAAITVVTGVQYALDRR